MTRPAVLIRLLIVLHLVWTFLLTPFGYETRPLSTINAFGWLSLAMIFTTVGLDIAVLVIATSRRRLAGNLAVLGSVLFVPAFLGDQFGLFSTLQAPSTIATLELLAIATQLAILVTALRLRQGPGKDQPTG